VTPNAPTWGDIEAFLAADGWSRVSASTRGGSRQRHVFYEKVLDDGRVLKTHVSHSSAKTMSPGLFGTVLSDQLEVSKSEFWDCVRLDKPVERPVPLDAKEVVEHEAWVVAVLVGELHMSADQLEALSCEEAEPLFNGTGRGLGSDPRKSWTPHSAIKLLLPVGPPLWPPP
jgi:hypothetical protein